METPNFPKNLDELIGNKYGSIEELEHIDFQAISKAHKVGRIIRMKRLEAKLTQQQLAERIGTQKSYISRIENGADMNLSTLFKIFDHGLNVPLNLVFGQVL
ncbi:MAG: helix-turn-helix transcriptional regulator [Bacteroidota bacterium]